MGRVSVIEDMPAVAKGRAIALGVLGAPAEAGGDARDPALFDAILYPNRSLPTAGFALVMSVVVVANVVFGTLFYAMGAWPVIGFCGLDVFLVWLAFRISYRQGRLHERIRVTREALWVARVLPSGHETRWLMQPFWTTVAIDDPVRHESQIQIRSKGRTLVVGSFLSPAERADLALALKAALSSARELTP